MSLNVLNQSPISGYCGYYQLFTYYNPAMNSLFAISLHTTLPQQCGRVETAGFKARQFFIQIKSPILTRCFTSGKLYVYLQSHCLKWELFLYFSVLLEGSERVLFGACFTPSLHDSYHF